MHEFIGEHIDSHTIMVVEVGSTAHGTGLPGGEDFDAIGVKIETAAEVFDVTKTAKSVMHRTADEGERSVPDDVDLTIHPLRRFLYLATSGNPSILMTLWSPLLYETELGIELRALAPAFIGRHVIPCFRGYMQSQTLRLLGVGGGKHGKRGGGQRPELIEAYGYDTKYAMHAARLGFQCIELLRDRELVYPIRGWVGEWLTAVRAGSIPFDEWWEVILKLDAVCESYLYDETTTVPDGPDVERITDWSVGSHLYHWDSGLV